MPTKKNQAGSGDRTVAAAEHAGVETQAVAADGPVEESEARDDEV